MLDVMDRRVTRSLSNELQARAAAAAQAQQSASNSYVVQNSYHAHVYQQHQHNYSVGQVQQHLQQHHQDPSSGGMNHHHPHHPHHHHQQQQQQLHHQQQQQLMGANGGMGGGPQGAYPRTTSDEMLLNTLMNAPLSPGTPTMETASLGFLDTLQPPQTLRGNSEELFNSWIATSTPENSNQFHNNMYSGPSANGNHPRQTTRRVSSELQAIIAQQNGTPWAPIAENGEQQAYLQPNSDLSDDIISRIISNVSGDQKQYRTNPPEDKSGPADFNPSNSLRNMWFSATSPMTRSRSSELRRRYAQLEGLPSPPSADALQKLATQGTLEGFVNHPPMTSMGAFARGMGAMGSNETSPDSRQMGSPQVPLIPTMSSPVPVNHMQRIQQQQQQQPPPALSALSDVVGLLKGSLERKKMQTKQQQQQQVPTHQEQELQQGVRTTPMSSPQVSARQDESPLNRSQDLRQHTHSDNALVGQLGQLQQQSSLGRAHSQQNSLGRAHSPDESSCGGLSHSAGMATSDGPSNSAVSVHRQVLKHGSGAVVDQPSPKRPALSGRGSVCPSNGENYENGATKTSSLQKPDHLTRASSITSSLRTGFQRNEIDGATKKNRVERQRKMAEAKGRGNAPPMPPDMQAAVKRCDTLEKEVRSLKLNLSFMNRKDSEQTKRIEELEQQNDELKDERDRYLEELDRASVMLDPQ